jgi:2-oxoisovalerate dehydrogenase E1 component
MPKSQFVDPKQVRAPGVIKTPDIPLNQYRTPLAQERKRHGDERLVGVLADMLLIREFETMLQQVKLAGAYEGIAYDNPGPAHLSVGQEAAAVGQALSLSVEDHIFGSHRSHGEILAKGMSAIRQLDEAALEKIMREFAGGAILKVIEGEGGAVKELARTFLAYGALAEIFARRTGFNQGLGGSMHAFFTPFGIYPNNAIVGGSGDIACGAALFKRVNCRNGIVVSNIGDAAMGCGPVFEALNFASMDQFTKLWDEAHRGGLPIIFNFMNNHYGMGGQTCGETMGYQVLARIGAGINPDAMHAERVDGYRPLAVADAVARKKQIIAERRGPVLLDTITYRIAGHSPSDASSYREREEIEAWQKEDSIPAYAAELRAAGILDQARIDAMKEATVAFIKRILTLAIDPAKSPYIDPERLPGMMFSRRKVERHDDRTPALSQPLADNPRVQQIAKKVRSAVDAEGKPVPKNKVYNLSDGIFEAMAHRFAIDPTMVAYGEEHRDWGSAFGAYRGLTELLPYHRFFNAPISEGAIVGTACGYALAGGRAVVELMYCDFLGRAGDEVFNQMAKWQSMSAGVLQMPVVLRISVGMKYGAQHSQDWTAMCYHIPGLKVAYPVTPYDAKGMLNTALAGSDPVVFFESQKLYGIGEQFEPTVPAGYYEIPEGVPAQRRAGKDLTIVTIGPALYTALKAAEVLATKGVSAEVWDLRWLCPLDLEPLIESAQRTGRVLVVGDAVERGSVMQSIAAQLGQAAFGRLDAPPVALGSRCTITPGPELEAFFFPMANDIVDTVHEQLLPLAGHTVTKNHTLAERIRRAKLGI